MTVAWEPWIATSPRERAILAVAWYSAGGIGGLLGGSIGGVAGDPRVGAVASAVVVALLQASLLGPGPRASLCWFGASAAGGALGMLLAVIGGVALQEAVQTAPDQASQGLAAWLVLSGLGGTILAGAQAPLIHARRAAIAWIVLGSIAGACLWPVGLALGSHYGPGLAEGAVRLGLIPTGTDARAPITQASCLAAAWLLHALPFGFLTARCQMPDDI